MEKEDILNKLDSELKLSGSSDKTGKIYSYFISKFLEHTSNEKTSLEHVNAENITSFLDSLSGYSNKSRALATSSLRYFFKKIFVKPELMSGIESPKKDQSKPNLLSKEEVKALISKAETEKSMLIISFLYSTGVKVSELVNLKVSELDLENKKGNIQTKEGKLRQIFLSEGLSKDIKKYLERKNPQTFLFSIKEKPLTTRNIQKIIKNTSKKAGISKKVTPHTLRHSFATHLLESGIDLKKIQALLGNSRIDTAQINSSISENLENIRNPLDNL